MFLVKVHFLHSGKELYCPCICAYKIFVACILSIAYISFDVYSDHLTFYPAKMDLSF